MRFKYTHLLACIKSLFQLRCDNPLDIFEGYMYFLLPIIKNKFLQINTTVTLQFILFSRYSPFESTVR